MTADHAFNRRGKRRIAGVKWFTASTTVPVLDEPVALRLRSPDTDELLRIDMTRQEAGQLGKELLRYSQPAENKGS